MRSATYLEEIPAGTPGLKVKLDRLRELVEMSKRNPEFRRWVLGVVRHVPEGDWSGELAAISSWIRRNVRYRHDPVGVELFQEPNILAGDASAGAAAGDCDDIVAMGAAMAEVLGHPSRFRVGGSKVRGQDVWSHIWRETWDKRKGAWVTYDDTAKNRRAGWSPARHYSLAGVTKAGRVDSLPTMKRCPVGVAVLDEYGCAIPGLAQMIDPDEQEVAGVWATDGALGSLKRRFKKNLKKVTKVARKVAPVAALAVNVIPGAGQVASVALTAAIAADKAKRAKTAAKRAARAEEVEFRKQEQAWNAEQDRIAMETQPPRTGGTVVAVPEGEFPFTEEIAPDPLVSVEPPQYPPEGAFDPAWRDDTEEATLGFDWGSVVNNAIQAGSQYAAAGGFGRRTQRAFVRYQPAITTAQQAIAPILTKPKLATPIVSPTTRSAGDKKWGGNGGGIAWALAGVVAFMLYRRK